MQLPPQLGLQDDPQPVTKWPDATFGKWSVLVDQTPGLDWNCKVVDPTKVSARSTKLIASSLTAATAAKATK